MRTSLVVIVIFALTSTGCGDAARAKAEAEAARAAQAKAEAELAKAKLEAELANAKAAKVEPAAKSELAAPRLLAPADGSTFDQSPRTTTLRWEPVAGATAYKVEVEYQDPATGQWHPHNSVKETAPTEYRFDFVGGQPGRWRVWAVDGGREGPKSNWWTFRYTR